MSVLLAAFVVAPLQAVVLDDMSNIAARPWTDKRDPGEGTGWLYQDTGSMGIDYGVTNDSAGVPHPLSGWTYLGAYVGPGGPGGCYGDPAICNSWWAPWCNSYYGKFDREISGPFTFAELGILSTCDVFALDVYKTVANSPEHVRELQLYDSLGNRNTYSVQAEATASTTGGAQGWKTYYVCLSNALENNADLTDIVDVRLWVTAWSAYPDYPGAPWPEYTVVRPTGTPVLIDDLQLYPDLACTELPVQVDIKPQSCPNPMPVKGKGVLTAAILGGCLDVRDIDAGSVELGGAPAIRSKYQDVSSPVTVTLDSMDNIAARPWTDLRDPGEGTGWLSQGAGVMKIDYGVTNDSAGVPHPLSGWDYLGNFVGVGAPGGCWGDPAICNYWWTPWCNSYYGKFDREISAPFTFAELGILSTSDVIALDVYKTVANSPEHVREIQLYDSLGNRNTYSVQSEPTAISVGAGWKTYYVCLSNALETNADLTDIVDIRLWVSSWSFAPNYPGAPWPDYTGGRPTGTPVLIDNLRLVNQNPDCDDCGGGPDGIDDLVLKFNRADIVPGLGAVHHGDEVDLDLTGNLKNCQPIVGSDCINIIGKADPAQRPPKK
ncbi:MAG: hypothetical protein ACYSR5_10175 [Planctomycetota bacterium]